MGPGRKLLPESDSTFRQWMGRKDFCRYQIFESLKREIAPVITNQIFENTAIHHTVINIHFILHLAEIGVKTNYLSTIPISSSKGITSAVEK